MNIKVIQSGSNREFILLKNSILLIDPDKDNLKKYIKILFFLKNKKLNVPKIKKIYNNFVIIQNLGQKSLLNLFLKSKKNENSISYIQEKYKLILKEISKLYKINIKEEYGILKSIGIKNFDLKTLKWEWQYFIENFLINYKGFSNFKIFKFYLLSEVFINTCYNVIKSFSTLIHRDLQSTNIIFYKNKPYLIDIQGIMISNFLYDLASLLEDPYINLPYKIKKNLLNYFFKINSHLIRFCKYYNYFKFQRLVQVLGAFSYLSIHKNKIFFIDQLKKISNLFHNLKQEKDYWAYLWDYLE
ncbi:MAG: phosphotransferase [bacterium]|nr:phosphotransferase [bacterium]